MNEPRAGEATSQDVSPLFRSQSVAAARDRMGPPVRPAGVASWILTAFLTTLLVVAIVFLCTARYARRETVSGSLQPAAGAARIISPRSGVLTVIEARDGQAVQQGQSLFTIETDAAIVGGRRLGEIMSDVSASEGQALERQDAAQRELILRQREVVAAKRQALVELRSRLITDAQLQQERVRLAGQTAEAAKTLYAQQLISALQFRQREEALIVAQQGLSAIERERASIPSSLAQLAAEDRRLLAEGSQNEATLASNRAQLEGKQAATRAETQILLFAPKSGRLAALQARSGSAVTAGQTLAIVLPKGAKLQAELWAPSRAAGFVRPGDKVRLMYDAFPYQRFGVGKGRVVEVAQAPTAPADLPPSFTAQESLYRVVVAVEDQAVGGYGRRWPLAPGMRLTADMVLEQQSLMAWLFDKVRAAQVRSRPL